MKNIENKMRFGGEGGTEAEAEELEILGYLFNPQSIALCVSVFGFSAEDHVHGREDSSVTPSGQKVSGLEQHLMHIHGTLGRYSQGGENSDHNVVPPVGDPTHLQPAPPWLSRWLRQIPLLNNLEPNLTRRLGYVGVTPQPRQRITPLNPLNDIHVFRVIALVLVRRDPFVRHVESPRFQNTENLGVNLLQLRRVTRGLD